MTKVINIGGRLHSTEQGNVLSGANEILDDVKGKKQDVINSETDAELLRLENEKQNILTFDNIPIEGSNNPVKSDGVYAADKALSDAIEAILILIPSAATALNQLADKAFVNSSVSTATATFRGTYNVVTDLELAYDATHEQIAAKLGQIIATADNNDYAYVQIPVSATSTDIEHTERYKFNGTAWAYEYDLNTSGFTAAQWEAINSAITTALVQKLAALPTAAELAIALFGKQDNLTFDNAPTIGSNNPVKSSGIKSAINDEKAARENADGLINQNIQSILNLIPTGATSSNKLVDVAGMEAAISVISAIIGDLDATFNIISTDGHITLNVTQENGLITAVEVQSSDIASAADITLLTNRMTTAEGEINTLTENVSSLNGRVGINERNIAYLQQLYDSLQQSQPEPVTTLPSSGQQQGVIYRLAGTTSYSDYMWNGSDWVLMATYNNAVDPRPKKASQNLVTSGGVFDNMGALDVSELNATENPHTLAKYVDLSAALAAIPTDYQKGGMSIKYVQTSDNKYVQYRLMSDSFNTTLSNWQGVDDEPTAGSDNLVKSGKIYKLKSKDFLAENNNASFGYGYIQDGPNTIFVSDENLFVTDFIPVVENDSIVWSAGTTSSTKAFRFVIFNANKEILTYYLNGYEIRTITMPQNAAYIRATFYLPNKEEVFLNKNGNTVFVYDANLPYYQELKSSINNETAVVKKVSYCGGRLYTSVSDFEFGTINNTTGLDVADTQRARTKSLIPIPILEDVPLDIVVKGNTYDLTFHFYDSQSAHISYISTSNVNDVISTPQNARYVRFRWQSDPLRDLTSVDLNGFYIDCYFDKCDNLELLQQIYEVNRKSYRGGILYTGLDDIEHGNINSQGSPVDNTDRWRSREFVLIPEGSSTVTVIRKGEHLFTYWLYWYDENNTYLGYSGFTDNVSVIQNGAKKVKMTISADGGSSIINSWIKDNEDLVYFTGCNNNELFETVKELEKTKTTLPQVKDFLRLNNLYVNDLLGNYIDVRGNITIDTSKHWDAIVNIDISNIAVGNEIEIYSGGFEEGLNVYYGIYNASHEYVWSGMVHKEIRTYTKQEGDCFISLSVLHSSKNAAYIKDNTTGLYIYKYTEKIPLIPTLHKIKIAEWNMGHLGHGTALGIDAEHYDEEIALVKQVLTELNADILFVCEFYKYTDRTTHQIDTYQTLLKQFFPYYVQTESDTAIFSKYPLEADSFDYSIYIESRQLTRGYKYIKGTVNLNGISIGVMCCHFNPFDANDRITEITDMVNMMSGYDLCIMSGDTNIGGNKEGDALINSQLDIFRNAGYTVGNYGYWGAKTTWYPAVDPSSDWGVQAIDNFFVKGINIDCFNVNNEPAASDHLAISSNITFFK